ncbi:hypothetical protein NDU88_007833 [Pleurodeles waltl]|uniref:CCHC-type domain-containing protein n=1 Tax=Pleurodeles waltl TaxID=8319 RepID=A0AAV7RR88_PLEWA|nr:hypothetical protein NDU88_007833 [Pleurodeles waltl]
MTDEMVRDQIIVHVKSRKIQEHFWVMGDPTLQDVISTAEALGQPERWMKSVQVFDKEKCGESEVVGAMKGSNLGTSNSVAGGKGRNDKSERLLCFRCGSLNHLASSFQCPAIGKECKKYGRVRHFARVCKDVKKNNSISKGKMAYVNSGRSEEDWRKYDVKDKEPGVMVLSLKSGKVEMGGMAKQPICEVQIVGRKLELMADSGSPWTIVVQDYFERVFDGVWNITDLKDPDIIAESFEGPTIDVMGFVETEIVFKERGSWSIEDMDGDMHHEQAVVGDGAGDEEACMGLEGNVVVITKNNDSVASRVKSNARARCRHVKFRDFV